MQNFDHKNFFFLRKTPIFSPKIEENCDHNIGPDRKGHAIFSPSDKSGLKILIFL
jgi:hypothetical protein